MAQNSQLDTRWKQRLSNFGSALAQLSAASQLATQRPLTDLEKQGLIQAFEFTHELAWNVMKDYFDFQGGNLITGSRDATREAFHKGLLVDGDTWMEMIKSRNQTSYTYNKKTAEEIVDKILKNYVSVLIEFQKKMAGLATR